MRLLRNKIHSKHFDLVTSTKISNFCVFKRKLSALKLIGSLNTF